MKKLKLEQDTIFAIAIGILSAIFFFFAFGIAGLRLAIMFMLVYIFIFYLFLNNLDLGFAEKIVFSLFIGIGVFPSLVYTLGLVISFRLAIFASFAMLAAAAFALKRFLKKNPEN